MEMQKAPPEGARSRDREIRRLDKWLEMLVSLLTLLSVLWGVGQYWMQSDDRKFSQNANAWQLLAAAPDGVNVGQKGAIELLVRHGEVMNGLHLKAIDLTTGDYAHAIWPFAQITWSNLSNADLRAANLESAVFDNTDMSFANLSGAAGAIKSMNQVNLTGTILPDGIDTQDLLAHACYNRAGPPPRYASGRTVPGIHICSSTPDNQAACVSPWCDARTYSKGY